MRKAELSGQRLPRSPEPACAVGLRRKGVQHVKQPVGGVRQGKTLGPRALGHKASREMRGDAPPKARICLGRAAQCLRRVDGDVTRRGSDGVAVVAALKQACLGEGAARPRPMEDKASPLGRNADEFQHALTHEHEAEGRIACAEQRLAACQAAITAPGKSLEEIGVHMTAIIVAAVGSGLLVTP